MMIWVAGLETAHNEGACFNLYPEVLLSDGSLALLQGAHLGKAELDFYACVRRLYRTLFINISQHYGLAAYEGPEFFSGVPTLFSKLKRHQRRKFLGKHFLDERRRFMASNHYFCKSEKLPFLIGHAGIVDMLEQCRLWFGNDDVNNLEGISLPDIIDERWPVHLKGWDGWVSIFCGLKERTILEGVLEDTAQQLGLTLIAADEYTRIRAVD